MNNSIKKDVEAGYILCDGTPLKCICGCTSLNKKITSQLESIVCEYNMICTDCGRVCGTWAYGGWML